MMTGLRERSLIQVNARRWGTASASERGRCRWPPWVSGWVWSTLSSRPCCCKSSAGKEYLG